MRLNNFKCFFCKAIYWCNCSSHANWSSWSLFASFLCIMSYSDDQYVFLSLTKQCLARIIKFIVSLFIWAIIESERECCMICFMRHYNVPSRTILDNILIIFMALLSRCCMKSFSWFLYFRQWRSVDFVAWNFKQGFAEYLFHLEHTHVKPLKLINNEKANYDQARKNI